MVSAEQGSGAVVSSAQATQRISSFPSAFAAALDHTSTLYSPEAACYYDEQAGEQRERGLRPASLFTASVEYNKVEAAARNQEKLGVVGNCAVWGTSDSPLQ